MNWRKIGLALTAMVLVFLAVAPAVHAWIDVQGALDSRADIIHAGISQPAYHLDVWWNFQNTAQRLKSVGGVWYVSDGPNYSRVYSGMGLAWAYKWARTGNTNELALAKQTLNRLVQMHSAGKFGKTVFDFVGLHNIAHLTHMIWPQLNSTEKANAKAMLRDEANTFADVVAWVKESPYSAIPSPGENGSGYWPYYDRWEGLYRIDLFFWFQECNYYYCHPNRDNYLVNAKSETCSLWGMFMALMAEMWPSDTRANEWRSAAKTLEFYVFSSDENYTDDMGYNWTRGRNVFNTKKLHDHGWGPNCYYTSAALYGQVKAQFARRIFNRSLISEYEQHTTGKMSSAPYDKNFKTTCRVDNSFAITCDCSSNEPQCLLEYGWDWYFGQDLRYELTFLPYWWKFEWNYASYLEEQQLVTWLVAKTGEHAWTPYAMGTRWHPSKMNELIRNLEHFNQLALQYWLCGQVASNSLNRNTMFPLTLN